MTYLLLMLGLLFLLAGGDLLIRSVSQLAVRFDVSKLVIGLVIVGFGTSLPELFASVNAARYGAPGISIGNVVGSNIANVLLILGITALIVPVVVHRSAFKRDLPAMLIATTLCIAACLSETVTRFWGVFLLICLCSYLWIVFRDELERQDAQTAIDVNTSIQQRSTAALTVMSIAGLAVMLYGADLFVLQAIALATALGVTKTVIGLTIVAVGTSLPELVTSVSAAIRKETDIAFGNVIGSNIFNIFGILGATSVLIPLDVPSNIAHLDIWVMAGAAVLLCAFVAFGKRIGRAGAISMLTLYGIYVVYRVSIGQV